MSKYEFITKNGNKVVGYRIYTSKYNSSKMECKAVEHNFNCFKSVASHGDFAMLVQNVVSKFELAKIDSDISKLEEKMLTSFGLTDKELDKLRELTARKALLAVVSSSVKVPVGYECKTVVQYPAQALLLANWVLGNTPEFNTNEFESILNQFKKSVITGENIAITEELSKDFRNTVNEDFGKMYSTIKDSIFKKWNFKIDLTTVRNMMLSCGNEIAVVNGAFCWNATSKQQLRKVIMHAVLNRMQCVNADADTSKADAGASK